MKKRLLILAVLVSPLLLQGCPAKNSDATNPAPAPTNTPCTDSTGHTCTPTLTFTPTVTFTPTATPTATPVPPDIAPIPPQSTSDSGPPLHLTLSAADIYGNPVAFSILTSPTHATAGITGNTCSYTPNGGYTGPDSFTFKATDTVTNAFSTEAVSITVTP